MDSPNIYVLVNWIRNVLAKLFSDSPLETWGVLSAIPGIYIIFLDFCNSCAMLNPQFLFSYQIAYPLDILKGSPTPLL